MMQMTDIEMCLLRFPNLSLLMKYKHTQINDMMNISTSGRNMVKKLFRISDDGVNPFSSTSSMKQSNDRNESDDDPTTSIDPKILVNELGNFMLNE